MDLSILNNLLLSKENLIPEAFNTGYYLSKIIRNSSKEIREFIKNPSCNLLPDLVPSIILEESFSGKENIMGYRILLNISNRGKSAVKLNGFNSFILSSPEITPYVVSGSENTCFEFNQIWKNIFFGFNQNLNNQESFLYEIGFIAPIEDGSLNITIEIDSLKNIDESNEENNLLNLNIPYNKTISTNILFSAFSHCECNRYCSA